MVAASWRGAFTILATAAIFYGLLFVLISASHTDRYAPRCWLRDDDMGLSTAHGKPAIRQYPIDCKGFVPEAPRE
jgi:hypothetical protein